jgi:hypothetical protein
MKRFLGIPLILLLVSCVQDRVKPYVLQERSQGKVLVKINFRAPSARDVYVAGTFNDWTVPRYKDEHLVIQSFGLTGWSDMGISGQSFIPCLSVAVLQVLC